jgi:hypothetical protein
MTPVLSQQEAPPAPTPAPVTPVAAPAPTPAAPTVQPLNIPAPKLALPEVSLQPQLNPSPSTTPTTPTTSPSKAPESASSEKTAAPTSSPAPSPSPSTTPASEGNAGVSTAPNATPQGSETANPGQPNGANQPSQSNAQNGQPSPAAGTGNTAGAQGSGTPGSPNGTYIQLTPHGDTDIMSHNTNIPKYRPTVFDKYWTPEGESSIDTALRHAVEKTTVSHTFNLPQGVRIKCTVMPLLPSSLFGCQNPDPPAVPLPQQVYDRLNLPSKNASIPKVPASAATQQAPSAPVTLDNGAECAAARVSGGPMPPNCPPSEPVKPLHLPAPSSSSWVPASDQFH